MPCFAPGSGRCLPGKRSCLGPTKNPVSQANIQESRPAALLPAVSPQELASASILVAAPLPSALFKLQLGWRTPGPCSPHGVSSAKELLVELKTQLFFLPPLQFLTSIKRLCRREPPTSSSDGTTAPKPRAFPTFPTIKMATNGGEAAPSQYVTLISADGFEFVVLREATLISPTIKGMLRSPFAESKTGRCEFPEIKYVSIALPRLPHHFHGHDLSHDEGQLFAITPDRPCPRDSGLDERDLHLI